MIIRVKIVFLLILHATSGKFFFSISRETVIVRTDNDIVATKKIKKTPFRTSTEGNAVKHCSNAYKSVVIL